MFNPWVGLNELASFEFFAERTGLDDVIDPIQFETRLFLYQGSPLLALPSIQQLQLEEYEFHYEWKHEDPRMDDLFAARVTPPVDGIFKRCCLKC